MKNKQRLRKRNAVFTKQSSTTSLINYSEDIGVLEVEFIDGHVHHYKEVELDKWEEYKEWVEEGRSSGYFLKKFIKPYYDVEELDD